ncbi:MAG: ATP-dependent zinc metalloprotease FtsH [Eubacteriales bacterium]|nr:ATP-dependent zinc metalloprotease FtsH [Eubacteriales bacterium]
MTKNDTPEMKNNLKETNPGGYPPSGAPGQPGGTPSQSGGPNWSRLFNILLVFFALTFLFNLLFANRMESPAIQIGYSQFMALVDEGVVDQAELHEERIYLTLKRGTDMGRVRDLLAYAPAGGAEALTDQTVYTAVLMDDPELTTRLYDKGVTFARVYNETQSSPILSFIISWIVPMLLMYLFYSFIIRRMMNRSGGSGGGLGGMFNVGKSKAKEYNVETATGVRFADVAGQDEAKESLMEMVDFLKNPGKYSKIGAKQPKGALLVGPPGTGKTMLAKAVAGEAKVPFYSISGSEFVEMFVGVGAFRVRDMFGQAKKNAPCIIFIDEIDAIGKSRDSRFGGNDEREQTLNQLLAEMDGFEGQEGIMVLAATNRPEVLDKALLRPGRFDRRIIVEKPDLAGREAILVVHAAKVRLEDDVDLRQVALATSGATGADLANMVNEAALEAVKHGREKVAQKDLLAAVELVIAGKEKKDRVMNQEEREMVAYHEVGHALVSALQTNSQPVQKITIVPRTMGSLGYTMSMPEEERYLLTKSEVLAQITTLLGGRAAETVKFGEVTTGASNDIQRATKLARSMVTQYGMSEAFGPMGLETTENQYLDGRNVFGGSDQSSARVDQEVRGILDKCQKDAIKLIEDNAQALERISAYLLDKENITGEEFMDLLKAA